MATLEKIRNKATLLIVVVGVALFAFIIGDFLRSGSTFFQQSKEKVIIVDGNSVGIRDYQQRVEYLSNLYKGSGNLTEEQQNQIRENVFQEFVNDILLKEAAEKIGIAVGKEELNDLILGNNISPVILQIPDFQNEQTGQFDKGAFIQFLQVAESDDIGLYPPEAQQQIMQMKEYWKALQKNVVSQRLNSKLMSLLSSGIAYNSLDAKQQFEETAANVDFDYVMQPVSSIPDSLVNVSDSEIAKLYEERKEFYKQDESTIIDYIAVNIAPSPADFNDVAQQMEQIKQELSTAADVNEIVVDNSDTPYLNIFSTLSNLSPEVAEFVQAEAVGSIYGPVLTENIYSLSKLVDTTVAPDSVFTYIITLPQFNDEVRLKQFSDSLIGLLKGGKPFTELAMEATNGQGNGEMGWQTELSLLGNGADHQIIESAFSAKVKEPQVVESSIGAVLIQVTERTKPVTKYKVAEIQKTVTPSNETHNNLYNELNQFISKNNSGKAFRDSASHAGYFLQPDIAIRANQYNLSAIKNSRQVIRWAFENGKGRVSDVFECEDYFIVATIVGKTKEGYRSLNEVSDILKRELLNKKKGEKILADLKAKNLSSLEQYAEAMNTTVQNVQSVNFNTARIVGIGAEPIVNINAVSSQIGVVTAPFAGNSAVFVLSVTDKKDNEQVYDEATMKSQLQMQNMYRLSQIIQSGALLQENAKIEDNRIRFY